MLLRHRDINLNASTEMDRDMHRPRRHLILAIFEISASRPIEEEIRIQKR